MQAAGQRKRTRNRKYCDSDNEDNKSHAEAGLGHKGKRSSRATSTAVEGDSDWAAEDSSQDPEAADSGACSHETEDGSEEGIEGANDEEHKADGVLFADLCRPLAKAKLQQLVTDARGQRLSHKTRQDYDIVINVLNTWYAAGGYQGMPNKKRNTTPDMGMMADNEVANLCSRFFEWYVVEDRPGDPTYDRRSSKVGRKQRSRSSAMKVHAALQNHIQQQRALAGRNAFTLNQAQPYQQLYAAWCSKKRDRALAEEADEGCECRAAVVHTSFGRDPYIKGAHRLLGSTSALDARLLSMFLGQVQMVARGDDLRGRKLKDLGTRILSCVGPSTAVALTVLQPPASGKALKTRPAYKGMLRAKLPELCGVGAMFRWLAIRFKFLSEPLPKPGTPQFKRFFIWGGRSGPLSYTQHATVMQQLFGELGVDAVKLTHELRIFAAQLLYEMGVPLEVIQRIGHWLLDAFGTAYIVPGFTAEALLALAFWPGAAQKDFTGYWAARFHVAVPDELVELLMPGLSAMEAANAQAAAAGNPSKAADHMAQVMRMGATVVVQDALELADNFPGNPVHKLLLEQNCFTKLVADFKEFTTLGGFNSQQPLSVKQVITQQTQRLQQHLTNLFRSSFGLAAPPLNQSVQLDWSAWEKQMQQAEQLHQQARAFQPQPPAAEEVFANLSDIAAGRAKPSQQVMGQVLQQEDVLAPAADSNDLSDSDYEERSGADNGSKSAAAAATAQGGGAAAATTTATSDTAKGVAPAAPPAADAALDGSQRVNSPDVVEVCEVQHPPDTNQLAFSTPSGKRYTAEQLHNRDQHTLTPGGNHNVAFFTAQHLAQLQQDMQQQPDQEQQQQQVCKMLPFGVLLQQQQQAMLELTAKQQSLLELLQQRQGLQQEHAAAAPAEEHASGNASQQVQQLQTQLLASQQDAQQLRQALQTHQLQARSSHYSSAMGCVDPLGSIMTPWIASQPQLHAVLGPAHNTSMLSGTADTTSVAAAVMAVLDQRDERLVARLAAMMGHSANMAVATESDVAATTVGVELAKDGAIARDVALGAGAVKVAAATGQPIADKKGFPTLSTHASVVELAEWFYINTLGSTGQTPQQLEQAGKADGQQWRGGYRKRHQRWAEYEQLLRLIEGCREDLNEDNRRNSANPHRVPDVGVVMAAQELDRERARLCLTVCEYREFKMQTGKGYTKGMAKLKQLEGEEASAGPEQQQADTGD